VMATHFFNDASLGTPCNAPMALCRAGLDHAERGAVSGDGSQRRPALGDRGTGYG
jgi:hypothetical protein